MKRYLLIKNIGRLITMTDQGEGPLGVIENGACLIKQGKIDWLGKTEETPAIEDYLLSTLDAFGGTLIPGLIDCHTHLVHGGTREFEAAERARGKSYEDIAREGGGILSTVQATRDAGLDELCVSAIHRADEALSRGVTTVEVKSGYGLDLETELKMLRAVAWLNSNHPSSFVPTFLGAHAIPKEYENNRQKYIDLVIGEMIPKVAEEGLAKFCDVFVENIAFTVDEARKIIEAGKEVGLLPKLHVDQLTSCGGAELAADVGAVSADHLEFVSDQGIKKMAENNVVAVVLPGSTFFLGSQRYAPIRKLINGGVNVALSTDYNPGTTPSHDLLLMATIASSHTEMNMEEALRAVTVNAAKALKIADGRGSIKKDGVADLIILDAPNEYYPLYSYGSNLVKYVIKDGKLLYEKK